MRADMLGGFLSIINVTPRIWNKTYEHSAGMSQWVFPDHIEPGQLAQIYLEESSRDGAAEVKYTIEDPHGFELQWRPPLVEVTPQVTMLLDKELARASVDGVATVSAQFARGRFAPLIISGSGVDTLVNGSPTDWMHQSLGAIGCRPLRSIAMAGSHDSGMSEVHDNTAFSTDRMTGTQSHDVYGQLWAGVRYFDIRPVLHRGRFQTGHYGRVAGGWEGGDGQSVAEVVAQVNAFTAQWDELVVLHLSHGLSRDGGFRPLHQPEWDALLGELAELRHRFVARADADLSRLALRDFVGSGPAVVVLLDAVAGADVDLGPLAGRGFFPASGLAIYNSYADTNKADDMIGDQLRKMRERRTRADDPVFLLSWTLTPRAKDYFFGGPLLLAHEVFHRLFEGQSLWDQLSRDTYPNIIMVDDVQYDGQLPALINAINAVWVEQCR